MMPSTVFVKFLPVFTSAVFTVIATAVAAGASAWPTSMEGVWASEGYGKVLEINRSDVYLFDVTKISCSLSEHDASTVLAKKIDRIDLTEKNRLSYYDEGGITRYDFTRKAELPKLCAEAKTRKLNSNPQYNFDVFWHIFNDHFAFFSEHNLNWSEVYSKYRPRVTAATTTEQLYAILLEIVELINDRHVGLMGMEKENWVGTPGTLETLVQAQNRDAKDIEEIYIEEAKKVIAENYLKRSRKTAGNGDFTWGWVAEGIGYFSIDSMSLYTDKKDATLMENLRLVDEIMEQVITDLERAKGIIVDARWNGGGYDANALEIASYFTDQHLLALTKKAKKGNSFTPTQRIYMPAHGRKRYSGPVVYLCGSDTLSAAEIFSMAMMAIPNVTSMGQKTSGSLSDQLSFNLPNGWSVSLSNEVYTAVDGVVYEGKGIPVDVHIPVNKNHQFKQHLIAGTDEAIAFLKKGATLR